MSLLGEALSAIREVAVSKFFDFLLDKLSEILQFHSEDQIQKELDKLKNELKKINALLDDAEEKQLKDHSIKIWLSELQNLAYDVDDIVDELETEASRRKLTESRGSSSKKRKLITNPLTDRVMMSKINDITAKLKDLEPRRNQLQLSPNWNRAKERQQPTSLQIETHVYGRDNDKETILELVFKRDYEGSFVIPIVGMGGIGKTTLTQLVYNDATVQNHFDLKAWVCVSDDFDVTRITKEILQSLTSEPCNDNNLNSLQEKLKKMLSEKKFLIVLDDVWNENYHNWTILQSPFLTRTPGSKIIVTTRSFDVSSTMGASHAHSLEVLSEDDCLSVFAHHALGARDFAGHPNLKEVGDNIVRKCSGLPLAAKTLGGLLRTNVEYDAWKRILESEIWKLSSDHRCGIIPALQLSYHYLPSQLKRCFAYCSILPKDYEFQERELILLWRAEGFLQEAKDKQSIEDLGHEYFRDLLSRSFFQRSNKDRSRFVMHDLINDLAQFVAGEICFRIESDKKFSKQARHLSYIAGEFDGIKKFNGISEAQHLRTFLPLRLSNDRGGYVTNNVLTHLLPSLRCLRVLSLRGYKITYLPDHFFKDLKHLRYLDFSYTLIECLPDSVSSLYNLETLLLKRCSKIEKLPSKMENLVNLCYLDITGADRLKGMPSNFGTLTNLQTLSTFVLSEDKGFQISELEGFTNLKGQLCISGLENVVETQDAWKAKLHDKAGLDKIELKWIEDLENRKGEMEKKVLDFLQPSKKLKELAIKHYCGTTLAKWVGDSSMFSELQSLYLENCQNCTSLPSVGQLPLLKILHIKGFHHVTSVGVELFGEKTPVAFPSLEILRFEDMPKWENWNHFDVDEEARKFPSLLELVIVDCPELLGSIPEHLLCLEKLVIRGCMKLVISIQGLPLLSELEIEVCHNVVYKGFVDGSSLKRVSFSEIPNFTCAAECLTLESIKVESLVIRDCLEMLLENNWGLLTQSMSVGFLAIQNLSQLVSVGAEEESEELMQLKIPCTIRQLTISNCGRLEKVSTLHYVTSLTELELRSCPQLISLSKNNLPLNLKRLFISNCVNLRCLLEEGENVNISSSSSNSCLLEQLTIWDCPSLVSLSSRGWLLTRLKQLSIWTCAKLESIAQEIQDNSSLECIHITECRSIKYLPQGLNKLSYLRDINISNCSDLVSFPESGLIASKLKVLSLNNCEKLQALPDGIEKLRCLEYLDIIDCSSVTSIPEEGIPTNLKYLSIGAPNICKPLMKWGLHRLTCLKTLYISNGCPDAVLFPLEDIGMMLPSTLTTLDIWDFPKLEMLSSKGFHHLTSLKYLYIHNCPNLRSLPEKDMLSSLLLLDIWQCPVLKERCEKEKGAEWSKIAHIPCVRIDSPT
ncbi:hypothetical protein PTKIN_Ptkin16aG0034200 [Pterospermum kingtungense]